MIFHPDLAQKILDGEKTVTRRRVKQGEECRYRVGRTYAIQTARGKPEIGRIRILHVSLATLADITNDDARLEGFAGVAGFKSKWQSLYGGDSYYGRVWRIEFEVAA